MSSSSSSSSSEGKRKHRHHHSHKKHHKRSTDKAIGTWVGVAGVSPDIQYIQFQVLPDGHIVFHSSIDIGQAFGNFPYGGALTIGQGYWKHLGCNKYATRQTQLFSIKDLDPANNHVTIPNSRIVVDSTFTISDDYQKLDGEFRVQFYSIGDINFKYPLGPPIPSRPYNLSRLPTI